jgi:peptidoglycan/xylan/chitin deacetylase (PgdA/CDA1 family)
MAHRTWLAGWSLKDRSAGVARRVSDASVALTFDDGPHPSSTGPVLDVLAQLDVVATFFFVGRNARQHPALVRRALAEGHAVGSHSMNHPHPATTPLRDLAGEYRAGRRAVNDAAGRDVVLFRPPHGHLGFRSAAMVRRLGVSPWLWTVDPEDWRPGRTSRDIVAVAARAQASDVVLLHDWVEQPCAPEARDRSATIEALPAIVRSIRDRGLHLTTLPT